MKRLVSAIVLAGGKSQRIGADKALLELEGQPLIARVLEPLQRLTNDVIIVAKDTAAYAHLGARMVADTSSEQAALIGLHAGLQAARHRLALAVACDMPFLDDRLLRFMIVASKAYDAVVPRMGGLPEPLHAAYRVKPCLAAVEAALQRGELKMTSFLPHIEVRYVDEGELDLFDPERLSFFNVNTQDDWERGQMLARRLRHAEACCNGEVE
jgi:molybdopterin-guanine dinucleotide biosynthesis protein A